MAKNKDIKKDQIRELTEELASSLDALKKYNAALSNGDPFAPIALPVIERKIEWLNMMLGLGKK